LAICVAQITKWNQVLPLIKITGGFVHPP